MWRRGFVTFGAVCILVGLTLNEWLVARLLTADGTLSVANRATIWVADISLLLAGTTTLVLASRTWDRPAADAVRLLRRRPLLVGLVTAGGLALACMGLIEVALILVERVSAVSVETATVSLDSPGTSPYVRDPVVGPMYRRGATLRDSKNVEGRVVYDVTYTIDPAGRRLTPDSQGGEKALLALFVGGSFVFGIGVEDDQTLPSSFAALSPQFEVLNYGLPGHGPQLAPALLESGRLDEILRDRRVVVVYLFIDHHLDRAAGSMWITSTWGGNLPRFTAQPDGGYALRGGFNETRPVRSVAYAALAKSRILRRIGFDLPAGSNANRVGLTVGLIRQAATRVAEKSRASAFYVLVPPGMDRDGRLASSLDGGGARVLDYRDAFVRDDAHLMPGDGHPTPLAHRVLARRLAGDLFETSPDPNRDGRP